MFVKIVNTPRYFVACIVTWTCLCGTAFHLIEHKSMITAVYWAIVTGSGVGYGDLYPTHVAGRLITMFYIASMIFLVVPLITAQFASKLIVNRDAWTDEEQEQVKGDLKEALRQLNELHKQMNRSGG